MTKAHSCDRCHKRRVGVTVYNGLDLCPECRGHEEWEQKVKVLRESIATVTDDMKAVVEHPEIIDELEPAQVAWLLEQWELLIVETKSLQAKIEARLKE